MARNKKVDARERMRELQTLFTQSKAGTVARGEDLAVKIHAAWERGEPVIVRKAFDSGDQKYAHGDKYLPKPEVLNGALRMARHNFFILEGDYDQSKRHADLQDIVNKAQPHASRLNRIDSEISKKKVQIAAAEAMVKTRVDELRTLESQRGLAEDQLNQALDGFELN